MNPAVFTRSRANILAVLAGIGAMAQVVLIARGESGATPYVLLVVFLLQLGYAVWFFYESENAS